MRLPIDQTLALLTIAMVCGGNRVLTAQAPPRRWEISWTVGADKGRSGRAIAAAMSAAGFDGTTPGGCFGGYCWGPTTHPMTYDGGPTGTFALSYAVRDGFALRFQWNTADLGEADGYRAPLASLFLHPSVTSVSLLAVVSAGGLHAGAGPALHLPEVERMNAQAGSWRQTRLGMTFHAGLRVPERRRVFADVAIQYQLVGSMAAGPFTTSDSSATLPRTRIPFSHHTIKLGLGMRL